MRSLGARGFSFLKLRRLSSIRVNGKKKEFQNTEENSSESRPSDTQQHHSEEYRSNDFEVANRVYVENHFDPNYLQNRSSLLAYGKQMKRVDQTLGLPTPPVSQARELESSRSWKVFRRNSTKPYRSSSWLSKIRRSPGRDQDSGSNPRNHLLSPIS